MTAFEYLRQFLGGPRFEHDADAWAAFAAVEHIEQRVVAAIEATGLDTVMDDLRPGQQEAVRALRDCLPPERQRHE